jgi:hypothetical protein
MTVSADTKLVAAGFSDSLVRLYHLALLGKQRGKLGERAEKRAAGVLPQAAGKRARAVSDCCYIALRCACIAHGTPSAQAITNAW